MKKYYVLYDKDYNDPPVLALCSTEEKANEERRRLALQFTEECFAEDPKESGLDREYDYDKVYKECFNLIGIYTTTMI